MVGLAATLDEATGCLARAIQRRLTTAERLAATVANRGRLRWRSELSDALMDLHVGAHSLLELRYLTRVERAHRLPTGHRQARRGRAQRLVLVAGTVRAGGRASYPKDCWGENPSNPS